MDAWNSLQRPAEAAENRLIAAILDNTFPINTNLPAERELCTLLGVTRPTLREALQRLARDGWIEIHQGRATRVRDYWREGGLGVLSAIAGQPGHQPARFVTHLLSVRLALAPAYAAAAVANDPQAIAERLFSYANLPDEPQPFAEADWGLHHALTVASGNPIYTLILNGFKDIYLTAAPHYFAFSAACDHSRRFYRDLLAASQTADAVAAERITRAVMSDSLALWDAA